MINFMFVFNFSLPAKNGLKFRSFSFDPLIGEVNVEVMVRASRSQFILILTGNEVNRCQFHQPFYVQIFSCKRHFSSYVLALAKNSYKKHAHKMLMKLTAGVNFVNVYSRFFSYESAFLAKM
jgi:hypothetical protein